MAAVVTGRAVRTGARVDRGLDRWALVIGRLSGPAGSSRLANARSQVRRLASAVIPLALTVGVAGMTLFQQSTLEDESPSSRARTVWSAEHVVAAGVTPGCRSTVGRLAGGVVIRSVRRSGRHQRLRQLRARSVRREGGHAGAPRRAPRPRRRRRLARDLGPDGEVALSEDAAAGLGGGGRRSRSTSASVTEPGRTSPWSAVYDRSLGFADVAAAVGVGGGAPDRRPAVVVLVGGGGRPSRPPRRLGAAPTTTRPPWSGVGDHRRRRGRERRHPGVGQLPAARPGHRVRRVRACSTR